MARQKVSFLGWVWKVRTKILAFGPWPPWILRLGGCSQLSLPKMAWGSRFGGGTGEYSGGPIDVVEGGLGEELLVSIDLVYDLSG